MRYNVPRLGPDGGFVHTETTSFRCSPVKRLQRMEALYGRITSLTSQLAEARKDGSPHWTSEKPTTPGYYWVRHTNVKDDKRLWYLYSNDILDYNWQFAGPVPEPIDAARERGETL